MNNERRDHGAVNESSLEQIHECINYTMIMTKLGAKALVKDGERKQ